MSRYQDPCLVVRALTVRCRRVLRRHPILATGFAVCLFALFILFRLLVWPHIVTMADWVEPAVSVILFFFAVLFFRLYWSLYRRATKWGSWFIFNSVLIWYAVSAPHGKTTNILGMEIPEALLVPAYIVTTLLMGKILISLLCLPIERGILPDGFQSVPVTGTSTISLETDVSSDVRESVPKMSEGQSQMASRSKYVRAFDNTRAVVKLEFPDIESVTLVTKICSRGAMNDESFADLNVHTGNRSYQIVAARVEYQSQQKSAYLVALLPLTSPVSPEDVQYVLRTSYEYFLQEVQSASRENAL